MKRLDWRFKFLLASVTLLAPAYFSSRVVEGPFQFQLVAMTWYLSLSDRNIKLARINVTS